MFLQNLGCGLGPGWRTTEQSNGDTTTITTVRI